MRARAVSEVGALRFSEARAPCGLQCRALLGIEYAVSFPQRRGAVGVVLGARDRAFVAPPSIATAAGVVTARRHEKSAVRKPRLTARLIALESGLVRIF